MKLTNAILSKKVRQINISIDTNTIYLQQYIDIVGIYGQE